MQGHCENQKPPGLEKRELEPERGTSLQDQSRSLSPKLLARCPPPRHPSMERAAGRISCPEQRELWGKFFHLEQGDCGKDHLLRWGRGCSRKDLLPWAEGTMETFFHPE